MYQYTTILCSIISILSLLLFSTCTKSSGAHVSDEATLCDGDELYGNGTAVQAQVLTADN